MGSKRIESKRSIIALFLKACKYDYLNFGYVTEKILEKNPVDNNYSIMEYKIHELYPLLCLLTIKTYGEMCLITVK